MTYDTYEASTHDARPVELYKFVCGSESWLYCSGEEQVEHLGETYEPLPIGRGDIEQTEEIHKCDLSVTVPRDNALASLLRTNALEGVVSLTLYRWHNLTSYAVYWKGRVVNHSTSGAETELKCESIFTSLKRPGLRRRYQRSCPHALYHRGCNVDKKDFAVSGLVDSISGTTLIVPEAAGYEDGWFTGGMIETSEGVLRFILGHAGKQLTLASRCLSLEDEVEEAGWGNAWGEGWDGAPITLYPGCDRTKEACNTKFSNLLNYGGFPWIPTRNPFDGQSLV